MKTQSYDKFWQRIHQSAKNKGFPLRIMFELTYRCPFKCGHCYVPLSYRKLKYLKTKEIFSILDELKNSGCLYLGFTGGEPFIRKDIMDILWFAKTRGFIIIVYTNGYFIDRDRAKQLGELMPNKVDITIPAMTQNIFEEITQCPDSYKKVFKTIEMLCKEKVPLGFKTCLLKNNSSEIEKIQRFSVSLNAQHRLSTVLYRRLDGSDEPYRYGWETKDDGSTEFIPSPSTSFRMNSAEGLTTSGGRMKDDGELKMQDIGEETKEEGRIKKDGGVGRREEKEWEEDRRKNTEDCDWKNNIDTEHKTQNLFQCGVGINQCAITPQGELKMCVMIDYPKYKIVTRHTPHSAHFRNLPLSLSLIKGGEGGFSYQREELKVSWEKLKTLVAGIKSENFQCDKCVSADYCKWCPAEGWLNNHSFTECGKYKK